MFDTSTSPDIKLWHCYNSRSMRPLWTLEEMELPYQLEVLPFPPRAFQKEYLSLNSLGTVPLLRDGDVEMTESSAMCHYLAEKYERSEFMISASHAEFADFLNWLYHSDATLTFPLALVIRYNILEPEERRSPQVAEDYQKWFLARLRRLDNHLLDRKYLCDNRFTIADICIGFALHLGQVLGLDQNYQPQTLDYLSRLTSRKAFAKIQTIANDTDAFSAFSIQK